MSDLEGGAFYDSRAKEWVDYIFEKDPQSPGTILVHAERLHVPDGLEINAEESRLRAEVYTLDSLLNAYRMRQLCSVDNLLTSSESVLHAHAELFLSRGYAAWNFSGQSRLNYEERLRRYSDPTLSSLFSNNAPVCTTRGNEVLQVSELQERIFDLERENSNLRSIAESASEEMEHMKDDLQEKKNQLDVVEHNLKASIENALAVKNKEIDELRNTTDLIVASALQEQKDSCNDMGTQESLKSYIKTLEKRQSQLEEYLLLAKQSLEEKTLPRISEEVRPVNEYTEIKSKKSCSIQ
jgi:hypothetical protein